MGYKSCLAWAIQCGWSHLLSTKMHRRTGKKERFLSVFKKKDKSSNSPSSTREPSPTPTTEDTVQPVAVASSSSELAKETPANTTSAKTEAHAEGSTSKQLTNATSAAGGEEERGISRKAAWISGEILILKLAKDAAEGSDVLAPLKAACGAAITILEAIQVSPLWLD